MTVPTPQPDPLGVALDQTEAELSEKLHEACAPASRDLSSESTGQLARLSDSLLAAARAAKDVVSLRKRRRERMRPADVSPGEIREFVDTEGREWRVWPVTPGPARLGKQEASLGEFQEGWLTFETLDESLRRRLPHYPTDWLTMSDESLRDLLLKAVDASRRADSRPSKPPDPPA